MGSGSRSKPSTHESGGLTRRRLLRGAVVPAAALAGATGLEAPDAAAPSGATESLPFNTYNRKAAVSPARVSGAIARLDVAAGTLLLGTSTDGQVVVQCGDETLLWRDKTASIESFELHDMVTVVGHMLDGVFHATVVEPLYRYIESQVSEVWSNALVTTSGVLHYTEDTVFDTTNGRARVAAFKVGSRVAAVVRDEPATSSTIAYRVTR